MVINSGLYLFLKCGCDLTSRMIARHNFLNFYFLQNKCNEMAINHTCTSYISHFDVTLFQFKIFLAIVRRHDV